MQNRSTHGASRAKRSKTHWLPLTIFLVATSIGTAVEAHEASSPSFRMSAATLTGGGGELVGSLAIGTVGVTIGESQPIGVIQGASGVTVELGLWPALNAVPEPTGPLVVAAGAVALTGLARRRSRCDSVGRHAAAERS